MLINLVKLDYEKNIEQIKELGIEFDLDKTIKKRMKVKSYCDIVSESEQIKKGPAPQEVINNKLNSLPAPPPKGLLQTQKLGSVYPNTLSFSKEGF